MRVQAVKNITVADLLANKLNSRATDERIIIEKGTVGVMGFDARSSEDLPMRFKSENDPDFWNVKSEWFVKV